MLNTKFARLSFNTNQWETPSGDLGKSENSATHENQFGFGFEEWLFNPNHKLKDLNGEEWHFGYIEGLRYHHSIVFPDFSLSLFTINSMTKDRYIIGVINEWRKLTSQESLQICNQNLSVITEMQNNLSITNRPVALNQFNIHLNNLNENQLFNIKFKIPADLNLNNFAANKDHRIYKIQRFKLAN